MVNVILFGNRILADAIELRWGPTTGLEWVLTQMSSQEKG